MTCPAQATDSPAATPATRSKSPVPCDALQALRRPFAQAAAIPECGLVGAQGRLDWA
jgi:hypothetical protein